MKKIYFSCYAFLLFVLAVVQKRNGKIKSKGSSEDGSCY